MQIREDVATNIHSIIFCFENESDIQIFFYLD